MPCNLLSFTRQHSEGMAKRCTRIARDEPLEDDAVVVAVVVQHQQRDLFEGLRSCGFRRLRQRKRKGRAAGSEEDESEVLVGLETGRLSKSTGWGRGQTMGQRRKSSGVCARGASERDK